jgi:hypothetical protein
VHPELLVVSTGGAEQRQDLWREGRPHTVSWQAATSASLATSSVRGVLSHERFARFCDSSICASSAPSCSCVPMPS